VGSDSEEQDMKLATLLVPVFALSVAGCGSETVKETKETVVEKPVPSTATVVVPPTVTKETIVEQPSLNREIVVERTVPALRSCSYLSTPYSHGSISCQNGYQYRCDDGTWDFQDLTCQP
jgi:hypothetical protein